MAHVRQQIREQVVAELLAGAPAFSNRIYSTRTLNLRAEDLPAANVFVDSEEEELRGIGGQGKRILLRTASIGVEIYATGAADIDDTLDDLAVEIEKVLGNSTLNNLAYDILLLNNTFSFDQEAENLTGVLTLFWSVQYQTTEGDPEVSV